MTFISIHSVIIYVVFFGACMRCTRLYPLKPGVTNLLQSICPLDMPFGTVIHNIEITRGRGGQLARAAGAVTKLIAKEGKLATLRLPSGEVLFDKSNKKKNDSYFDTRRIDTRKRQKSLFLVPNRGLSPKRKVWIFKSYVVRDVTYVRSS
jgi:hypothetical protein